MRLLGFPIHVRSGFVFAIALAFSRGSSGGSPLIWIAAYTGFLLVHELGHAWTAQKFGARNISISLDFLVGYATFEPPRGLARSRLALISLAGPVVQIVSGVVILAMMGANPLSIDSVSNDSRWPVFFLGPMLGLFNLVPLLPLDGGSIVSLGIDRLLPGQGRRLYQITSLVICAGLGLVVALSERYRFLLFTFGLLAVMNLPGLRRAAPRPVHAEQSPWSRAAAYFANGDHESSSTVLLDALSGRGPSLPPTTDLDARSVDILLGELPDPLPVEDPQSAVAVHRWLHQLGYLRRAADFGIRLYARHPDAATAALVAEEMRLLGDGPQAASWRTRAAPPWGPPVT